MAVALYPGSFDPVHVGHVAIIEGAAAVFDELVVAIMGNPAKPGRLPVADRLALVRASTRHIGNVSCAVHDGLVVDAAHAEGAMAIVRSSGKEHRSELTMARMNAIVGDLETMFVPPPPASAWVSSTLVWSLAQDGRFEELAALVPAPVLERLRTLAPS